MKQIAIFYGEKEKQDINLLKEVIQNELNTLKIPSEKKGAFRINTNSTSFYFRNIEKDPTTLNSKLKIDKIYIINRLKKNHLNQLNELCENVSDFPYPLQAVVDLVIETEEYKNKNRISRTLTTHD